MFKTSIIQIVLLAFVMTSLGPLPDASAQTIIDLPPPGIMVHQSGRFQPLQVKGILVNIKNPLRFDFLVDKGASGLHGQPLKDEITRLAKYFLTCLAVPEAELWVNLSPYEKDRIVPGNFGVTLMGKNLLEQDYLLKQIMASLSYPENELGKVFWRKVYRKAYKLYGTTAIPVNTFNKVWIVPKSAHVYAQGSSAFVVNSRLDVMLEADYLAMSKHRQAFLQGRHLTQSVIKEVILPQLRQEVNEGKNFAVVRQVYHAMILAVWYKRHLKDSVLGRMYVGRNEVRGIDIDDKKAKEKIFQQYLKAYKKCVYNYIKDDYDPLTGQTVARKYASGGMYFAGFGGPRSPYMEEPTAKGMQIGDDLAMATVDVTAKSRDGSIISFPDYRTVTNTNPFHILRRQDGAMVSPRLGPLARRMLFSFVALLAVGVSVPSVKAAQIIPHADGKYMDVVPEKKDARLGLGGILQQVGYDMPLWGKQGAVAEVKKLVPGLRNANKIYVNKTYTLPTPQEFKRLVSGAVQSGVPASGPLASPAAQLPQQPAASVAASPAPPLPAPDLSASLLSAAGSPPPEEHVTANIVGLQWPWYIGMAVAGIVFRKVVPRNKRMPRQPSKPAPVPNRPSTTASAGWQFKVGVDHGPALPDDEETAWFHQQQHKPSQALHARQPMAAPRGQRNFRLMDYLNIGLSVLTGGLSAYAGHDWHDAAKAFMQPYLMTGLSFAVLLWLHEIGHLTWGLGQYIGQFLSGTRGDQKGKKAISFRNIFANYSLRDWMSVGFFKNSKKAGVDLDFLTEKSRSNNQKAGFLISLAAVASGWGLWLASSIDFSWALAGSLGLSSSFLLYNAWLTDIWKPSASGKIECGNGGFIWLPGVFKSADNSAVEQFFPQDLQTGLGNMKALSELRGDQGKGIFTWGQAQDGDIVPVIFKTMKSKRGSPVIKMAVMGFNGEVKKASGQKVQPLSGAVREVVSHDRFLTQGTPSREGLQPQLGHKEKRMLCLYTEEGRYQRTMRTALVATTLNGDNDYYRKYGKLMPTSRARNFFPVKFQMPKSVFIAPNAEHPKGYFDYLPTGDTPALALEIQWHDNQGDWWAASRFAVDDIFYHNDEESMEYNLSGQEGDLLGQFFMDIYIGGYEERLIRPKLVKADKTLADSWVDEKAVKEHPLLRPQYLLLEEFRQDLKSSLLEEAQNPSSEIGRILNKLQDLHADEDIEDKISRLVDKTVQRFFTADLLQAVKEVNERADGTGQYGVRALSSKYPAKGVFWTRGQSIALGVNKEAGYMAYNSEHTALMAEMGSSAPVQEILFLNSFGQGQITETYYDHHTHELTLKVYSPEKERFLSEHELKEWRMELDPANEYHRPLVKRDSEMMTSQDIDDISKAIKTTRENWQDPHSFVRRSALEVFQKLVSRYVERFLKDNSKYYRSAQGELMDAIQNLTDECRGEQCPDQERAAALLKSVLHDPRILSYLKSVLDRFIAIQADEISAKIIQRVYTEDDLFMLRGKVDARLKIIMEDEIRHLSESIVHNKMDFLPAAPSIGSGEADIFASGLEDSLWLGAENLQNMLHTVFPQMVIETDSSNKALNLKPNDHRKVGRRTLNWVFSKSGATSPSKNLVPILEKFSPGNTFIFTGEPATLMGLALGQRYHKGAEFKKRIFPLGHYYPSEVNSVSEVELMANQIELVLFLARGMKKIFPHQRPWGMDLSAQDIKKMEKWREGMLAKSVRQTGVNEDGKKVLGYKEHEEIAKNGRIFGRMLRETLWVKIYNFIYVYGIVNWGVLPGAVAGSYFGFNLYGHYLMSLFDTILIAAMPWVITTFLYRKLFKKFIGRAQVWGRMGAPKVTIGDLPVLHQSIENSASKRGGMAIGSMDADYHGGNPRDHFGARFLQRLRRGSVEIFGVPEHPQGFANMKMTANQSNVRTDLSIGNRVWDFLLGKRVLAGPEIFTLGHGPVDANLSHHHMDIGPLETVDVDKNGSRVLKPGITPTLSRFYDNSFDVLDRLIAYNVFFNTAYEHASKWRLPFKGKPLEIFRHGESINRTAVMSTPSPVAPSEGPLPDYHDDKEHYSIPQPANNRADAAQTAPKGGIDMNNRWMKLTISGHDENRYGLIDGAEAPVIKGVDPKVSQIVPVTPNMLKNMLGEGYLN